MRSWKLQCGALAFTALLAVTMALPAAADEAPALPQAQTQAAGGQHGVAVITVVRARDLMNAADRQAYRRAMREAGSEEARQRIRAATFEQLRERAAEHGVVMVIETRMLRPGERPTEANRAEAGRIEAPARPAAPPPRAP